MFCDKCNNTDYIYNYLLGCHSRQNKKKKMSVSSKKIFIISVAVGIIALMVSVVNLFELDM